MKRFQFRLQRVLNYRTKLEERAERIYAEARSQRELAERHLDSMRDELLAVTADNAAFSLERAYQRRLACEAIEDRARHQEVVIATLLSDELKLRERLLTARRDRQTLERLREKALEHYSYQENLSEQRDLDEWAALQRRAA